MIKSTYSFFSQSTSCWTQDELGFTKGLTNFKFASQ